MQFDEKNFLIYLISRVFFAWTFLNFLACCVRIHICIKKNQTFLYSPMEEPKYAVQLQIPDQSIAQQQHTLINENAMDTRFV